MNNELEKLQEEVVASGDAIKILNFAKENECVDIAKLQHAFVLAVSEAVQEYKPGERRTRRLGCYSLFGDYKASLLGRFFKEVEGIDVDSFEKDILNVINVRSCAAYLIARPEKIQNKKGFEDKIVESGDRDLIGMCLLRLSDGESIGVNMSSRIEGYDLKKMYEAFHDDTENDGE